MAVSQESDEETHANCQSAHKEQAGRKQPYLQVLACCFRREGEG